MLQMTPYEVLNTHEDTVKMVQAASGSLDGLRTEMTTNTLVLKFLSVNR